LATEAMNKLQGAVLPSCERGGIRIEYARTKMGDLVGSLTLVHRSMMIYLSKGIQNTNSLGLYENSTLEPWNLDYN